MNRLNVTGFSGDGLPSAGVSVGLFSFWNKAYEPLANIAYENWGAYCKRNGFALRFYPDEFHLDPSRPDTYGDKGKFELYMDMRGLFDIVMFLDIDSLFMNDRVQIDHVLGYSRFIWTYDENGPLSGLWIARTDEVTQKHLRFAYEKAARENNVRHGVIEPNGISDQDAMRSLMGIPPFSSTFGNCQDSQFIGHCYPENHKTGKWIVTFPGRSVEKKLEGMEKYAKLT